VPPVSKRLLGPPPTLLNAGWLVLLLIGSLAYAGNGGIRPGDSSTLNMRRVAGGTAGLALAAYLMFEAQRDFRGGWGDLITFFVQVVQSYSKFPALVLLSTASIALIILVSVWRIRAGWRGLFPNPDAPNTGIGEHWAVLIACSAAWVLDVFVPRSWGWGRIGDIINLGLQSFYVFSISVAGMSILCCARQQMAARKAVDEDIKRNEFDWWQR
jgi:hypothetical protein